MPQIAQIAETYASQIFWLAIVFGLIYFGIGKAMLPKVEAIVEARDRKIADDLAEAGRARASADEIEADYRARIDAAHAEAQQAALGAKTTATADAERRVKAADAELAQKIADAEAKIATVKAEALRGIEAVAAEAATEIVGKISGTPVSQEAALDAVKAAMAHG
ncbi:MAG: ATPase [Sphingomonadaceae bacterium]